MTEHTDAKRRSTDRRQIEIRSRESASEDSVALEAYADPNCLPTKAQRHFTKAELLELYSCHRTIEASSLRRLE